MLTENFLLYGQPEPPPALVPLRAGPLAMLYDPASGMIRRIKLGEREVLRGVYAAVRDRNWGTVPGQIRELARESDDQSFRIEFESEHRQGEIHFVWRGWIAGAPEGELRYEFEGEAKATFLRNRIGFCVLHPVAECAGAPARQVRTDGRLVDCRFPDLIEPQIFGKGSFQELRSVAHEVAAGIWAEVEFTGDTFEMEDQRNWTDASFKTYCTPLTLPFPIAVHAGTRIQQSVRLRLQWDPTEAIRCPVSSGPDDADVLVKITLPDAPAGRLPTLGLGVASHGAPLTDPEAVALRRLGLSHLRVDVPWSDPGSADRLEQAVREAAELDVAVELAVYLPRTGEADFNHCLRIIKNSRARLARVLALRTGEPATSARTLALVRKQFAGLGAPIGAGSDCNFCELNREHALGRFGLDEAQFVFWSINPQVHASDPLSIMETLEAQTATVLSARAFAGDHPLLVSPVTLKQRFNPVATGAEVADAADELPPQVDSRQLSQFAAAWTVGCFAALASAGVASATFYETTGWRGVIERATGSPLPGKFPSAPGTPFPMFAVLAGLAGFTGVAVANPPRASDMAALALFAKEQPERLMLANLSASPQRVQVTSRRFFATGSALFECQPYDVIQLNYGCETGTVG